MPSKSPRPPLSLGLPVELGAPLPRGREAAVDARARIHEVIRARAVEPVAEEVRQYGELAAELAAKLALDVELERRVLADEARDGLDRRDDGREDARDLRVLVEKDCGGGRGDLGLGW